jgi:sodium transport system permease protein
MKKIGKIIKKELLRIFKNPALIVTMFILPGLLLFMIYQFIGTGVKSRTEEKLKYSPMVILVGVSEEVKTKLNLVVDNTLVRVDYQDISKLDELKERLTNGNFDYLVECNTIAQSAYLYYNSKNKQNDIQLPLVTSILSEVFINERYYVLSPSVDIIPESQRGLSSDVLIMASIIPMLIMTFLFQGAMSVAPESIAGEKERGTISTLLSTPVKRSSIAIGKIIALIILSCLSAISSFLGVFFSLSNVMPGVDFSYSIYGVGNILLMLLIIIVTVSLIVTIIANISAIAKSIQQASALSLPLMFLSMIVGLSSMLTDGAATNSLLYLIPIFNSSQILFQIFTLQVNYLQLSLTIISNVVFIFGFIFLLTKLFKSEKFMFNK